MKPSLTSVISNINSFKRVLLGSVLCNKDCDIQINDISKTHEIRHTLKTLHMIILPFENLNFC